MSDNRRIGPCYDCGRIKKIVGKGFCGSCYNREYFKNNPIKWEEAKAKDKLRHKEKADYSRRYYLSHKEIVNKRAYARFKIYRENNLKYLESIKPLKCEVCGYNKCFGALDLHHVVRDQKNGSGDKLSVWLYSYCPKRFIEKMEGLEFQILCANCHRELHFIETGGSLYDL